MSAQSIGRSLHTRFSIELKPRRTCSSQGAEEDRPMVRRRARTHQLEIDFHARGGARPGAGRKPKGLRAGVSHKTRPTLAARHPVHVTTRVRAGSSNLRCPPVRRTLERVFAAGSERFGFRLVHYSIQSTHLHLVVEACDRRALGRGMKGLLVRAARALNRLRARAGNVFADRYHAHVLRTPREVRNALVYVFHNAFHHGIRLAGVDPYTSGAWFDGWRRPVSSPTSANPCVAPLTWLLRFGWRRHGLVSMHPDPISVNTLRVAAE
jgi:putative transposase